MNVYFLHVKTAKILVYFLSMSYNKLIKTFCTQQNFPALLHLIYHDCFSHDFQTCNQLTHTKRKDILWLKLI